jgi:exonuclease III
MSQENFFLLNLNVRGLNAPIKRSGVKEMVQAVHATAVCLQETKLQVFYDNLIRVALGPAFVQNYSFLPSRGSSGGILIAVSANVFRLISSRRSENALTVKLQMLDDALEWHLTGVYGPQMETGKLLFLEEMKHVRQSIQGEWLVTGDFNIIYKAQDKNNPRVDKRIMGKFKSTIDELELRELPLHGRKFTWTSEKNTQAEATMSRIDRMFCSTTWEEFFPAAHLHAWVSTLSDHCPLILQGDTRQARFKGFKFK